MKTLEYASGSNPIIFGSKKAGGKYNQNDSVVFAQIGRFGKDVKYTLNKTKCREFDIKNLILGVRHGRPKESPVRWKENWRDPQISELWHTWSAPPWEISHPSSYFFGGMHLHHEFFTQHSQRLCMLWFIRVSVIRESWSWKDVFGRNSGNYSPPPKSRRTIGNRS